MKILNIGSLNIDKTYTVKRFVQPKETIRALKYEEFCGGKGLNQSTALAKAEAEIYHAGAVGKDGKVLVDMLNGAGACTEYIKWVDDVSGHAVIQLDETGQNNIIIVGGANERIEKEDICSILEKFEAGDIVLLQNEITNVDFAIEEAKRRGMLVAFNPSPINEMIDRCDLKQVDYFILNEVEGQALAGIDSEEPEAIKEALKAKFPDASFVLTLGEKGSVFFNKEEAFYQNSFKVDVVDTTGAGDTFCGYFLAGVARGNCYEDCLKEASAASAIAVTRKGAAAGIPERKEVLNFLRQ